MKNNNKPQKEKKREERKEKTIIQDEKKTQNKTKQSVKNPRHEINEEEWEKQKNWRIEWMNAR